MVISSYYRTTNSNVPVYKKKNTNTGKSRGPRIKYSDEIIRDIRIKYQKEHRSIQEIATLYPNMSISYIGHIIEYRVRARIDVW